MSFLVPARQFYEMPTGFAEVNDRFEPMRSETLWTEPHQPSFTGPLALLVDEGCMSSCEGFALIARRRPGAHIVGVHGTYGSFGMSGAEIAMPGGLVVEYPDGQSLDEQGRVQLDSDEHMIGGVEPDVRVPLTAESVQAQLHEHRDIVLEEGLRLLRQR
jgi:carboxyl-terminal processing protease